MTNDELAPPVAAGESPAEPSSPLIIATILPENGVTGVHTHMHQLRRYLRAAGEDPGVVTPFSWGWPVTAPVLGLRRLAETLIPAAGAWWYHEWNAALLEQALKQRLATAGNCVVYAQCPWSARAALRARRGRHQRVVAAVHFRVSLAEEWVGKGVVRRGSSVFERMRRVEKEVLPEVDGLVFVSSWARDALTAWLPQVAAVPSVVVNNFVAPLDAPPPADTLADLVTVGSLEPVKNHAYLLSVLAEARRVGRVYSMDVFGKGPLHDDLAEQIHSRGLERQVRLLGFRADVASLLPAYRAYVHASTSESLPLAIVEAMAAGLPVIAGDAGGIGEVLDDGVEGLVWPLDDAEAAARRLITLLDDEDVRARAAAAAARRFSRELTAEAVAPRLLSFVLQRSYAATGVPTVPPGAQVSRAFVDSATSTRPGGQMTGRVEA